MKKRKTQEQFIDDCIKTHGNKYDYSLVEYKGGNAYIKIKCRHGVFEQRADSHLRGYGCRYCVSGKDVTNTYQKKSFLDINQPHDYKLIPLHNGQFAKVDNEDFDKVKDINWNIFSKGYAYNTSKGLMHRFIMNCPNNMVVDHINHDTLDNRRDNLRVCTKTENLRNQKLRNGCTSKYKGVSWNKQLGKWRSYIGTPQKHLGLFDNEEDAARAYDKKARELFKEFAYLNFKD